jgi:alpha-ketoglutarate-dependent taurine dioxygenase
MSIQEGPSLLLAVLGLSPITGFQSVIGDSTTDLYFQDYYGDEPNRPPIDTHHPAIRTHPVTGLKALNVNPTYCTGFAELKKAESDALLQFLNLHIHSSDDHYVRWKWAVGSIAMWDNVRSPQHSHLA